MFTVAPVSPVDRAELDMLTEGEREELIVAAEGLSNAEIAEHLFVSEATVKSHVGKILTKLGLKDRVRAAAFAFQVGLVRPSRQVAASASHQPANILVAEPSWTTSDKHLERPVEVALPARATAGWSVDCASTQSRSSQFWSTNGGTPGGNLRDARLRLR
jgi:DNA-binding CsgD family transcriptional regulator